MAQPGVQLDSRSLLIPIPQKLCGLNPLSILLTKPITPSLEEQLGRGQREELYGKSRAKMGIMVHAYNSSTEMVEAGELPV